MKTQKIFEVVLIVKQVVKVRILRYYGPLVNLMYLFFNFPCLTDTAIFPYTKLT